MNKGVVFITLALQWVEWAGVIAVCQFEGNQGAGLTVRGSPRTARPALDKEDVWA